MNLKQIKVDFFTFAYAGDIKRLNKHFQLQVKSNGYQFNSVNLVLQKITGPLPESNFTYNVYYISDEEMMNEILKHYNIDPNEKQYESDTDQAHSWRYHCVNHLYAAMHSRSDFIVFADADCWMVEQPDSKSWIEAGIDLLNNNRDIFLVSPNDGEPERKTLRMSQQMFMVRTDEFRYADFTQPGYSGNPRDYDTMPEYHAMLEGRIHYHCEVAGKYRYVLGSEFRYWHHNRLTEGGYFETDRSKY